MADAARYICILVKIECVPSTLFVIDSYFMSILFLCVSISTARKDEHQNDPSTKKNGRAMHANTLFVNRCILMVTTSLIYLFKYRVFININILNRMREEVKKKTDRKCRLKCHFNRFDFGEVSAALLFD